MRPERGAARPRRRLYGIYGMMRSPPSWPWPAPRVLSDSAES